LLRSASNEYRVKASSAPTLKESYLLPYLERLPRKPSAHSPVIIMLHGRAAKAETIFSVEGFLDPSFHIISIRGTYESPKGDYEWFLPYDYDHPLESFSEDHFSASEEILTNMILQLLQTKKISEKQVFLLGFSQGAAMSYILSLRGNIKPRGVIAMSGFFPRPIMQWKSFNSSPKFLITHGTQDETLPASESIFADEFLSSKGISSEYYEYKGRHKMTPVVLDRVNNWILSQ
jgi:phospholipase/carboxylesterase